MSFFADVVVIQEPEITVSYRSGLMVFEEGLRGGRWVALNYSASGHLAAANDNGPIYMNASKFINPQSFRVNVDGQDLFGRWQWGGIEVKREEEQVSACVTLISAIRPVTVRIHTLLDGTAVMQRTVEVINEGDRPMALSALSPLSGAVQQRSIDREHPYRVGYMKDSVWGHEGDFHWENLPDEIYTVAGRYRRDRHRHPMFLLENRYCGETFVAQLAWSGGYAFTFDMNREGGSEINLEMNIAIDGPAPLRVLAPGEGYVSPAVHLGVVFGGLDPAIQEMHDHIRKSVMLPPTRGVTGWIESGIGPEYHMDIDSTMKSLEHAHSLGSEVFFIDAGWYLAPNMEDEWWDYCGDWRYNEERYPGGLEQVRQAAHEKGLLFGMWMDADRIGSKSRVWREHQDWIVKDFEGKPQQTGQLNLGNPEAAHWMEEQIRYLLDNYKIDMFRLDHNVDARRAITFSEHDGFLESNYARYYENVYDIYRRLRRDYPNVIFENCAGGGGRTDLGMVSNFTHTWVTDGQIHPRAFSITNGMTMALPPECVDRLIGGQAAYQAADMTTLLRNLMFARASIGGFKPPYAQANPIQMDMVRHHVELYKTFVRPMHRDSRMYHHTPELSKALDGFGVLELAKKDASQGMIGIFRLAEPEASETTVYPRGVNPAKTYRVTYDNYGGEAVCTGAELMQGLHVCLGSALTSELILYREA